MTMPFDWDEEKADENRKKHGISFDEAKSVFRDSFTITIDDPDHSEKEQRFIDIGYSRKGRILIVVYTERGKITRIISCRKATLTERKKYEQQFF
ncbi:MAG: BrnT family toxin [Chloroflexi bacterium]|nr:BrnT family toxin [Chloroflexota bacterium]